MWPTEKNGRIGNFDPAPYEGCFTQTGGTTACATTRRGGFIVPSNVNLTGNAVVDGAIAATNDRG